MISNFHRHIKSVCCGLSISCYGETWKLEHGRKHVIRERGLRKSLCIGRRILRPTRFRFEGCFLDRTAGQNGSLLQEELLWLDLDLEEASASKQGGPWRRRRRKGAKNSLFWPLRLVCVCARKASWEPFCSCSLDTVKDPSHFWPFLLVPTSTP